MRGQIPGLSWDPATKKGTVVVYLRGSSGKRRKHRFTAASEGQARTIARRFIDDVQRELVLSETAPASAPESGGTITLEDLFAFHLERFLAGKSEATESFYRAARKAVDVDGQLGSLQLHEFTKAHIEDFMLREQKAGKASTTAANYGAAVVILLRWAVDRDLIPEFPIKKRIQYPRREKPELELSPEEEQRFLGVFRRETFEKLVASAPELASVRRDREAFDRLESLYPLLLAGMRTGLRKGDLLRLTWMQVNLDDGWIEVMTAKKKVPVALGITADLRSALQWCRTRRVVGEQVFLRHDGRPWTVQTVKDAFDLAKRVAGITRRLRFHDATRHTLGSTLVSEGMTIEEVAAVLGHRDSRSTARYARVRNEAVREKFLAVMNRRTPTSA